MTGLAIPAVGGRKRGGGVGGAAEVGEVDQVVRVVHRRRIVGVTVLALVAGGAAEVDHTLVFRGAVAGAEVRGAVVPAGAVREGVVLAVTDVAIVW